MNAQQLWQAQAAEVPRISLAYVRHRASSLEQRTRWRNLLEYAVAFFGFCVCTFFAWQRFPARPLMIACLGWLALWSLWYMYRWHRFAASQATPAEAGVLDTLRYQRRQLERQRDARRDSWRWWGLTPLPGYFLMLLSMFVEQDPVPWDAIVIVVVGISATTAIGVWALEREARRFQREIDALDSLADER
jgi:hypothetical protein